jgi:hypothetical protein
MSAVTESGGRDTLAWEAEHRTRAGIASILAGLFTLGGGIAASLIYSKFPTEALLPALREWSAPGPPTRHSLKAQQVLFYDHHGLALILVSIALALGALLVAGPLLYLFEAIRGRRPELPQALRIPVVAGPVILAVATVAQQVAVTLAAHHFAGQADQSSSAAGKVLHGGWVVAPAILKEIGVLVLALAFVLVSLNAMRVGLLTRFMGILGMISGALFVIPILSTLPVVQAFWLVAVGVLLLGYWPSTRPPAWTSGRAEPWPSQQEIREQREAARAAARGGEEAPARGRQPVVEGTASEDETPEPGADRPAQARSKKKKRRR